MFIKTRHLLFGAFVVGLFLFFLVQWHQSPSGEALFFFLLYALTGALLLLHPSPSYWALWLTMLNGVALFGLHKTYLGSVAVWMLYLLSGVFMVWRLRDGRHALAVVLLLGLGFVVIEGMPFGIGDFSGHPILKVLPWVFLLMSLLYDGWWHRYRLRELEQSYRGLQYRTEEMRKHISRFLHKAEELSVRDSLTGLYNLKGFQQNLPRMMRKSTQVYLLLLDVVSFSEYNAYMGREAGDELLRKIADVLRQEMPAEALLSRYAGDKFAIAVAYDGKTDKEVEEKIRTLMERIVNIVHPVQHPLRYCVGMAIYPRDAKTWQEMINVAEKRLAQMQRALSYNLEAVRMRKERLSTIGQLAAALAHEIRNPLTSVRGFVQLAALKEDAMDRWKEIVLSEIDRIDALLSRLLEIADHQWRRPRLVCLNDIVQKTLELMQTEAVMRGFRLRHYLPQEPICAWVEEQQIQQVLVQLIQYGMVSVENRDDGFVEVTLDEQEETAILVVRDNGDGHLAGGMSMEDDPWAMNSFGQLKNDLYGFSFSLIQQIVSEHGGKLSIHRLPLGGNEAVLYLPKGDVEREMQLVAQAGHEPIE